MATGANSDVVPLRKATKAALAALRDGATFDEVIQALLALAPADLVRARLRPSGPSRPPLSAPWRDPEKQRLTADLALEAWAAWRRQGRVADRGMRALAYFPKDPTKSRRANLVGGERRGLPP